MWFAEAGKQMGKITNNKCGGKPKGFDCGEALL